ncbi:MAG TPA: hypothetical protein VGM37_06400 [Armatimonadota bacterium]|jgi:hypothetical protein
MNTRDRLFLTAAVITTVASLCTPGTASFVRQQLRDFLPSAYAPIRMGADSNKVGPRLRAAARRLPADPDAACAAASTYRNADREPNEDRAGVLATIAAMHAVDVRFPAIPSVLAAEIGALAMDSKAPGRMEEIGDVAARGERADPGNALFPAARSAGFLTAGRTSEGLAALRRAADCPRWSDYQDRAADGRARLLRAAGGPNSGIVPFLVLYPMSLTSMDTSGVLRHGARSAADLAVSREAAGRIEEGIAIRHALMTVGGRMRAQSSAMVGSLVGCAIQSIAAARPGGAPAPLRESASAAAIRYVAWLRDSGHEAEAAFAERELANRRQARDIARRNADFSPVSRAMERAVVWQSASRSLFFFVIVLVPAAWLMSALGRRGARPGITALPMSAMAAYGAWDAWQVNAPAAFGCLALAVAMPLVFEGIAARPGRTKRGWRPFPFAVPLACALVILAFGAAPFAARAQRDLDGYARAASHGEGAAAAQRLHMPWPD